MALKFPTVKRYSGEGAESMLAFFWQLLRDGVQGEWHGKSAGIRLQTGRTLGKLAESPMI